MYLDSEKMETNTHIGERTYAFNRKSKPEGPTEEEQKVGWRTREKESKDVRSSDLRGSRAQARYFYHAL